MTPPVDPTALTALAEKLEAQSRRLRELNTYCAEPECVGCKNRADRDAVLSEAAATLRSLAAGGDGPTPPDAGAQGCICPQDGSTCWTCAGTPSVYCKGYADGLAAGQGHAATPAGDVASSAQPKAECLDCGKPYVDFPLDMTLPDDQWLLVHPAGFDGLLCAGCIVARAKMLPRVVAVRAQIEFAEDLRRCLRCGALKRAHVRGEFCYHAQDVTFQPTAAEFQVETGPFSAATEDGIRAALAECERLKDVPTTPVGPVVYTAHKAKHGRPSFVKAQWRDAAGRRITQFVATCQSTRRDTDADAELIAAAFNAREVSPPAALDREALLARVERQVKLAEDAGMPVMLAPELFRKVLALLRSAPVREEP